MTSNRSRKRKEPPCGDPTDFIREYAQKHGLITDITSSDIGKECVEEAEDARQDFKELFCMQGNGMGPERRSRDLPIDEKHEIRLENNRNAGRGMKVYEEVLFRLLSSRLLQLEREEKDEPYIPDRSTELHPQIFPEVIDSSLANEILVSVPRPPEDVNTAGRDSSQLPTNISLECDPDCGAISGPELDNEGMEFKNSRNYLASN